MVAIGRFRAQERRLQQRIGNRPIKPQQISPSRERRLRKIAERGRLSPGEFRQLAGQESFQAKKRAEEIRKERETFLPVRFGERKFKRSEFELVKEDDKIKVIRSKRKKFKREILERKGPDEIQFGTFIPEEIIVKPSGEIEQIIRGTRVSQSGRRFTVREPFIKQIKRFDGGRITTFDFGLVGGRERLVTGELRKTGRTPQKVELDIKTVLGGGFLSVTRGPLRTEQALQRFRKVQGLQAKRAVREGRITAPTDFPLLQAGFTRQKIERAKRLTPKAQQKEFGGVIFDTKDILRGII